MVGIISSSSEEEVAVYERQREGKDRFCLIYLLLAEIYPKEEIFQFFLLNGFPVW